MTINIILEVPELRNIKYTFSSKKPLTFQETIEYAKTQGTILQSAQEAAAFAIKSETVSANFIQQLTRTVEVYIKRNNNFYCIIDDIADYEENIALSRAEELSDKLSNDKEFTMPSKDKTIVELIMRAEKSRMFKLQENELEELSTKEKNRKSEFGSDRKVIAVLGKFAEQYASHIRKTWQEKGFVKKISKTYLESLELEDKALVKVVVINRGFFGKYNLTYLGKKQGETMSAYARGVKQVCRRNSNKEFVLKWMK